VIDWAEAWEITAVAFGFTFAVLLFLSFIVILASFILTRIPGNASSEDRPANNNNVAGE